MISSANGFRSKTADGRTAIQLAYDMLTRGADPLDAIVSGVQVVELDPTDHSVGLGGLPTDTSRSPGAATAPCTASPSAAATAPSSHRFLLIAFPPCRFCCRPLSTRQRG